MTVTSLDPVKINESEVIQADVMASNGVIHVIDAVLMPPSDEEPTKGPTAMEESDSAGRASLAVAAAAEQATVDAHGEVSDAFDAALRLNAAEHDAQMEVACSHFFCGAAADYDVPPMSRHSMGPVQMLNDYSETLELSLIHI